MGKHLRDGRAASLGALGVASCCFGALMGVLVVATHRTGAMVLAVGLAAWKPFAGACFAGLLVLGGGLVLFYAREGFDRSSQRRRRRLIIGGIGAFVAIAGWLVPLPVFVGGAVEGLGVSLLLLAWLDWFALRTMAERFSCTGLAFAVAAAVSALLFCAPASLVPLGMAVLVALAWIGLLSTASDGAASGFAQPEGEGLSPKERLKSFAAGTWRPVVGAFITMFVFGFTWDTDLMSITLNYGASLAFEKVIGMALGAALFVGLSRFARKGGDAQRVLFNTVLPLMVLVFVIRPYFLDVPTDALVLTVFGVLREAGFALFLGAAWIAVSDAARESDVSTGFSAGVLLAGFGACGLAGLGITYVLGPIVSYMGAILFTFYIVIIAIVNAPIVDGAVAKAPADAPKDDLEAVIARRCEALSDAWALTPREREVMALLTRGHSYPYIAKELVVSENTVRTHVRNVYRKAKIGSREELIALIHQDASL